MRLGLTLSMLPQETLPSFVSHIAQKNSSRYVQDFVQDMGLSWRRILQLEPEALQDLADLTGADPDGIAAHSFMPTGNGGFRFKGCDLPRSLLDRSTLKVCPRCVQADTVDHDRTGGRAEWQIDPLNVCPVHGVLFYALPLPDYPRCPHDFVGRMAEGALVVGQSPMRCHRLGALRVTCLIVSFGLPMVNPPRGWMPCRSMSPRGCPRMSAF